MPTSLLLTQVDGGVPFPGLAEPTSWKRWSDPSTWPNSQALVRRYTAAGSVDEVANGDGTLFYRDTANAVVWLRVQGGLPYYQSNPVPGSDGDLYRGMGIRIQPAN